MFLLVMLFVWGFAVLFGASMVIGGVMLANEVSAEAKRMGRDPSETEVAEWMGFSALPVIGVPLVILGLYKLAHFPLGRLLTEFLSLIGG